MPKLCRYKMDRIVVLLVVTLIIGSGVMGQILSDSSAECGGSFSNETGQIVINFNDLKNDTCTWFISRGKNDSMTTLHLSITSLPDNISVSIYSGNSTLNSTKLIKTFVGSETGYPNGQYLVSLNEVTSIVYKKYTKTPKGSVTIDYTTLGCHIDTSQNVIASPLYLSGTGDLTCTYSLGKVENDRLARVLTFSEFYLPHGNLVIEGEKTINLTGSSIPDDEILRGNYSLNITLNIKNSSEDQTVVAVDTTAQQDCSLAVSVTSMKPMSIPNVPRSDCRYVFTAPEKSTIVAAFPALKLSGGDSLTVQDGGSQTSKVLQTFTSASKLDQVIVSSGNKLWVRVQFDELVFSRQVSFLLQPQTSGGRFSDSGKFTLDASSSTNTSVFHYQFDAPSTEVKVQITDLKTKHGRVQLYDGEMFKSPEKELASFSKQTDVFTVTGNGLLMAVNNFTKGDTLKGTYGPSIKGCDMLSTTGLDSYVLTGKDGDKCTWSIKAKSASAVGLLYVKVTKVTLCPNSTLTISDSVTNAVGSVIGSVDGTNTPKSIPLFYVHNSHGASLVLNTPKGACKVKNTTMEQAVEASYVFSNKECGSSVSAPGGELASPLYPDNYPLNAKCKWTLNPDKTTKIMYIMFNKFDIRGNHSLFFDKSATIDQKLTGSQIDMAPYAEKDFITTIENGSKNALSFSSSSATAVSGIPESGPGFQLGYRFLECGGLLSDPASKGQIKGLTNVSKSYECIWIISLPNVTKEGKVNIVSLNVNITGNSTTDKLTIIDGGSMNGKYKPLPINGSDEGLLSRTNMVIVHYIHNTKTEMVDTNNTYQFNVAYTIHTCEDLCQNNLCMHQEWKCDGKNDCGDNSDEINCNGTIPITTPPPVSPLPVHDKGKGYVKSYVTAVVALVCFGLGIVLTIAIPKLYRRIKYPNYNHLHDMTVTA